MATKNYMINDKWLDLDKQNIVELQSVDGELDSLKVNGSEIVTPSGKIEITENGTDIDIAQYATADVAVEGGGGGDFSTAEVTVTDLGLYHIAASHVLVDEEYGLEGSSGDIFSSGTSPETFTIILYKGKGYLATNAPVQSMSGNITYDEDLELYVVTGNGAITISGGQ